MFDRAINIIYMGVTVLIAYVLFKSVKSSMGGAGGKGGGGAGGDIFGFGKSNVK